MARLWSSALVGRGRLLRRAGRIEIGIYIDTGVLEEDVPGEQLIHVNAGQVDGFEEANLAHVSLASNKIGDGLKLRGRPATQDGFIGDCVKVSKC